MRGKAQLEQLTAALLDATPECANDNRFIADAFTESDTVALRRICRRCPLLEPCNAYAQAGSLNVGFWAGRDYTPRRAGRPRQNNADATAEGK